jgi:hypothetical protein
VRPKACKGFAKSVKGPLKRAKCFHLRFKNSRFGHHVGYFVSAPVANGVLNTIPKDIWAII